MGKIEICSGFNDVRFSYVRVFGFDGNFTCSGCSDFICDTIPSYTQSNKVDFVEKMWRNLRKNLWVNCGKVLRRGVDKLVLHILGKRFARFDGFCGKFYKGFTHRFNRGRGGVLHIFHIAYYYNYYFI